MPEIKGLRVIFLLYCGQKSTKKDMVKMVDICRKIKSFFPPRLYASDNLVHILLQLGTFHAYYTNHKNYDFLFMLHELFKETAVCITADQC